MVDKIEMVLSENQTVVEKVSCKTGDTFSELISSLQEFQQLVNNSITKLIEERGQVLVDDYDDYSDGSDEENLEDNNISSTPKKRKK